MPVVQGCPCKHAVEADELRTVVVEDSCHEIASIGVLRKNHDDEAPFAHVLHVMLKIGGLLRGPGQPDQRSLESRQEAMLRSARIEAMQAIFSVQDVDVLPVNPGPKQRFDGRARMRGVGDGADDAVGRIRDEVTWTMRRSRGRAHHATCRRPCWQ